MLSRPSQLISDFEHIHFHSSPESLYGNFAGFLEHEAAVYVALTRAGKYSFCSWGPVPGNQERQKVSEFFTEMTQGEHVLGRDPGNQTGLIQSSWC